MPLPISGIRWYRGYPSIKTSMILAAQNALWIGGDPATAYPPAPLTQLATFTAQNATIPVGFASARDPRADSDVLIICGFTGPYGFGTGKLVITGTPATGQTITVTLVNGATTVTTPAYTVLPNDSISSVAQAVSDLINNCAAVVGVTKFLGQATWSAAPDNSSAAVAIGALSSGTGGNAITYNATVSGAGVGVTPGGATAFTGGGASTSAPLKWDGANLSGLSYQIQRPFTGCVAWHNHVWLWGDPAAPDTLFAADIDTAEDWSFMLSYGGYDIGTGDGDASLRAVVPVGNILYVFKPDSIYAITGYDFQSGEYQFQVQPAIRGYGTPGQQCVATLGNALVFWSGRSFYRLQAGAFDLEPIGRTIPITCGLAMKGDQSKVRAVAGDFFVTSNLNESYAAAATNATELFSRVAFFAVDVGRGVADTVLVYDDDASQALGNYAWSKWTGWEVGAFVPLGSGENSTQSSTAEPPLLCFAPTPPDNPADGQPLLYAYGTDPAADNGEPINFLVQTGWVTFRTGALMKNLHRLYLELEATSGVILSYTVTPSVQSTQAGHPALYPPAQGAFGGTGGIPGGESHQTLVAQVNPSLKATAYIFAFGENSATSNFELISLTVDYIQEEFPS